MSAKNTVREHLAYTLLALSLMLGVAGWLAGPGWALYCFLLAAAMFAVGGVMFTSLMLIQGVPWITRLISHHVEPVWEGEILHTDGAGCKVRYLFDDDGRACFVASDVCDAVGLRAPHAEAQKWGGVALLERAGHACFSEEGIQEYLLPLAIRNHEANRLLILVRNNVLRKLNKQRETVEVTTAIQPESSAGKG